MALSTWKIDPVHSSVELAVSHMHVSTFRSRFSGVVGTLRLDEENPAQTSLEASVEVKSLEVRDKPLYDRLMGDSFLWADKHPQLLFRSTKVERRDATHWQVDGELTIRGVTRPQALEVEALGGGTNPFGGKKMKAFRARGALQRGEFGITWNAPLDIGAPYLGETVTLELQVEVVEQPA